MDTALAPGLLLAAPRLEDPNFDRTVVLLGHHDDEGAVGWVLNGEAIASTEEVLRAAGLIAAASASAPSLAVPVRRGGPVSPGSAWLLFARAPSLPEWPGEIAIGDAHAVATAREAIQALARGDGPRRYRLLLGYAGWAPGQLEAEISAGAWLPAPLDAALLLEADVDTIWDVAYHRATGAGPGAFGPSRGSA